MRTVTDDLDIAHQLIEAGVPVIVCQPHWHSARCKDGCDHELDFPTGWATATANAASLANYKAGIDTLAMIAGHGVDVIDVDPKAGGSLDNVPAIERFGMTSTPSGGCHLFVRSTGFGKVSPFSTTAGFVGDYAGGTADGGGRLPIFLPGSTRPKYPNSGYRWVEDLDLDRLLEAEPDDTLIATLLKAGASVNGKPGKPAVTNAVVAAFLAEHSEIPAELCGINKTVMKDFIDKSKSLIPGDPIKGRHGWMTSVTPRLVELMRNGCATSADWDRIVERLHQIKPEGGTDPSAVLAWAIANADGTVDCRMHNKSEVITTKIEAEPRTLDDVHKVFRRWLGEGYDLQALDAVLAAAAVEQLDGDPVWLLLLSGPGNTKTETVAALAGAGAIVTSTITSEGALLSATSTKDKAKDATGGLLRRLGDRGVLVIKDVTSVLSMNRDARQGVLAALREVYDGKWERNVGTDGGRTLTWNGRLVVIGAVTSAWDVHHGVIAALGDRFAIVRTDSAHGRLDSGRQALANVGHEAEMRPALSEAVAGLLGSINTQTTDLAEHDIDVLLGLANLVTLSRTAVERDYRGDVIEAHAPEAPTRLAKMLAQMVRGARAIGLDNIEALAVAARVAGDSVPPLRLAVLADVADHPGARTSEVTKRLQRPRTTVDRALQELHVLGLVTVADSATAGGGWQYSLADVDRLALSTLVTRKVTTPGYRDGIESQKRVRTSTDFSGDAPQTTSEAGRWPL